MRQRHRDLAAHAVTNHAAALDAELIEGGQHVARHGRVAHARRVRGFAVIAQVHRHRCVSGMQPTQYPRPVIRVPEHSVQEDERQRVRLGMFGVMNKGVE